MNRIANRRKALISAALNSGGGDSGLPFGYTQVDYIETTGEPYLELDFSDLLQISEISQMEIILTAQVNTSNTIRRGIFNGVSSGVLMEDTTVYTNTAGNFGTTANNTAQKAAGNHFALTITYENGNFSGKVTIGTTDTSLDTRWFNKFNTFVIGRGGGYTLALSMKIEGISVSFNNTISGNLVPCYRKSDGEIGMFDLVNNQFHTNSGAGNFLKGPDVN